jgi:hypothetical protein
MPKIVTNDQQSNENARAPYVFIFESGRFIPGDPLGIMVQDEVSGDWDKWLESKGFDISQTVGDDNRLCYVLYENDDKSESIVMFHTPGKRSWYLARSWPDLIGLLSMLSNIVLAGIIRNPDWVRGYPAHIPTASVDPYPNWPRE